MIITKTIEIDMAHKVPNHKSKCRSLHGHRYKIEVGVDGIVIDTKGTSDEGMVIDFGDLKELMMQRIDNEYDHNTMIYDGDPDKRYFVEISKFQPKKIVFTNFIPTAENIAKHFYQQLKKPLQNKGITLRHVIIWETPTSTALYFENENED